MESSCQGKCCWPDHFAVSEFFSVRIVGTDTPSDPGKSAGQTLTLRPHGKSSYKDLDWTTWAHNTTWQEVRRPPKQCQVAHVPRTTKLALHLEVFGLLWFTEWADEPRGIFAGWNLARPTATDDTTLPRARWTDPCHVRRKIFAKHLWRDSPGIDHGISARWWTCRMLSVKTTHGAKRSRAKRAKHHHVIIEE